MDFPVSSHLFQYLRYCTTIHSSLIRFTLFKPNSFAWVDFFLGTLIFPDVSSQPRAPSWYGFTLSPRPLPRARNACEQAPHSSLHKPWASLYLLLGSPGGDRKYLSPGGAETAALERRRNCRGICWDCLRTLWPFCRCFQGTILCLEAWEIQPVNQLLVLRCREGNPLSRECTQGLLITHLPLHHRSHLSYSHTWVAGALQGSTKASLSTSADLATCCRKVQVLPVLKASLLEKFQKGKKTPNQCEEFSG